MCGRITPCFCGRGARQSPWRRRVLRSISRSRFGCNLLSECRKDSQRSVKRTLRCRFPRCSQRCRSRHTSCEPFHAHTNAWYASQQKNQMGGAGARPWSNHLELQILVVKLSRGGGSWHVLTHVAWWAQGRTLAGADCRRLRILIRRGSLPSELPCQINFLRVASTFDE